MARTPVLPEAIPVGPLSARDRDRGTPRDATPPTPPGIRVPYHGGGGASARSRAGPQVQSRAQRHHVRRSPLNAASTPSPRTLSTEEPPIRRSRPRGHASPSRAPTRAIGRRSPNLHGPHPRNGPFLPAVSSLGGFRTPAHTSRTTVRHRAGVQTPSPRRPSRSVG
jgi:hypothetical protein